MYVLIALLSMTNLGTYHTRASCENAIRSIYVQRTDPYGYMDPKMLKRVVDLQVRYSAPKEFRCQAA